MKNVFLKTLILSAVCLAAILLGVPALASQPPVANAGPDLYASAGQSITLQGSGSDPDGNSITYLWTCNGGSLSNSAIAQPTFAIPSFGVQNYYTCTLTVSDTEGFSNLDLVNIYTASQPIGGASVQTNPATNIYSNQATLNGQFATPVLYSTGYVWFQWGTTTSYGSETAHQIQNNSGAFSQNISGLSPNTTYHFRAVAHNNSNIIYGQDTIFYTSSYGTGTNTLSISKKVINLSSGNVGWQSSVAAKPGDILSFAITIQAPTNQDIHNVFVKDILPLSLIYRGNLTVNANISYLGNPASGINIGTIPAGGIQVIAYQAQAISGASLAYGTTVVNNNATITSTEAGSQTTSASVIINNTSVSGATNINTGITNNPVTDSFLLPIALIVFCSWLYFSGNIYKFSDWMAKYI